MTKITKSDIATTKYTIKSKKERPLAYVRVPADLAVEFEKHTVDFDKWDLIYLLIKQPIKVLKLVLTIVQLFYGIKIMNQSTLDTIKGIVKGIMLIVAVLFGIAIPDALPDMIMVAIGAVWALWEVVAGYISNNKKYIKPETKAKAA